MAAIEIDKPFNWKQISLKDELLKSYVAVYTSKSDGDRTITFDNGKLFSIRTDSTRYEILPYAKDKFFFEGKDNTSTLEFIKDSKNNITAVILKNTSSDKQWNRSDKPIPKISVIDVDAQLTFNFDENANVISVTLHQNGDQEVKRIE